MDEKIDKIIDLCGTKNKYQYILVFISFISWINNMMVSIALPFLEKTPEIIYIDPKTKEIKTSHLNYTICTWDKSLYNISKIYEYSWVNEFNISCDQVKTGLIGSLNFGGSFLGSITLNFFADNFGRKNTIIYSLILYIILNTWVVFMKSFYFVMMGNFILNALNTYINYTMLMMVEEVTNSKLRGNFGTFINSGFPACGLVYFPLFIYLKTWQKVFIVNSIIAFSMLILFLIFSFESPRYFFFKGNFKEGLETLLNISKFHHIEKEFMEKINSDEYKTIIDELIDDIKNKKKKNKKNADDSEELLLIEKEKENIGALSLIKIFNIMLFRFLYIRFL
jgi:MFS family permease